MWAEGVSMFGVHESAIQCMGNAEMNLGGTLS